MTAPWLKSSGDAVIVTLHIQPGAKKTEVAGEHGEALKIRLAAPPVDGKANAALIEFLSDLFDIPKARVTLVSGQTSRAKRIALAGVGAEDAERLLAR